MQTHGHTRIARGRSCIDLDEILLCMKDGFDQSEASVRNDSECPRMMHHIIVIAIKRRAKAKTLAHAVSAADCARGCSREVKEKAKVKSTAHAVLPAVCARGCSRGLTVRRGRYRGL